MDRIIFLDVTPVSFYQIIRCHISEDTTCHIHQPENIFSIVCIYGTDYNKDVTTFRWQMVVRFCSGRRKVELNPDPPNASQAL
jgi:hypothetical protein